MNVFLDTNVILDCILERKNDYANEASIILNLAENGNIKASISPGAVYTIIFILQKSGKKGTELRDIMISLLSSVKVLSANSTPYLKACKNDFSDLEDAFQYEIALDNGEMNYFVTGNIKDFKKQDTSKLPVITPKQFLDIFKF